MKSIPDPYAILGIVQNATVDEIRTTYESLVTRLTKSVQNGSHGAKEQLRQVKQAYKLLTDQQQAIQYTEPRTRRLGDKHGFTARITPSKRVIENLGEPQVLYLLIEIMRDKLEHEVDERTAKDVGLNLTLVLDHSNSMKGVRLDRVKVAATEIIDQLSEKDYLSVITFNDRADTIIEATPVKDKKRLASRTRMTRASGGTEIFQGLFAGVKENRKYLSPKRINHIILLTDGNTYGDQEQCLNLAHQISAEGISLSALGLGSEWNDKFLDELASATGGSSAFIKSPSSVVKFMNNQVQSLANSYAERLKLSIATDEGVEIEMLFKIKPSPQPLPHNDSLVHLGGMQHNRPLSVLAQLQIPPNLQHGFRSLARVVISGDIIDEQRQHTAVSDVGVEISEAAPFEEPPHAILDALGKLTLYRMQEQANDALERGDIVEATQRLENLATRLLDMGEDDLAKETMDEIERLKRTQKLSDAGRKTIKYHTRMLINH